MRRLAVIGGGPAGAAAAITARQLGTAVLLIEAAAFPRFRPGESLHPGIEPALAVLDADRCLRDAPYLRYPGTWVSWGSPQRQFVSLGADHRGTWLGYQVPRAHLDAGLLSLAERAGAEVWRECKAHAALRRGNSVAGVTTDQGSVEADAVIDASGAAASLARQLGVPLTTCSPRLVAHYGYADGVCLSTKLPSIRADEHGWTWLAQVAEHRYHWTRVMQPKWRVTRSWRPDIYKQMKVSRTGGADVTWRKARQVAGPGWFLCGEAGAVLDPASSHGVLRGILSGRMAAHLAVAVLGGKLSRCEAQVAYQQWFDEWFYHDVEEMSAAYRDAGLFGF